MPGSSSSPTLLHGIDFTSAPCKRKGITIATGTLDEGVYRLQSLEALHDFDAFDAWLREPGPWLGAFDFPFSFPRELVETLGWPTDWAALMQQVARLSRVDLRNTFQAFCNARPAGKKFAHRATDHPAGSSSPMKWVNPPVAYMLHAGVPRLIDAGLTIYTLHAGDPHRIALEAYPGLLARSITRASYKTDERAKQTLQRQQARLEIVEALERGEYRLKVPLDAGTYRDMLILDPSGDWLDATLCGLAAAWAWERRRTHFGLPEFDPLEGWIVGA
jgi:hypothetical protein